MSYCRGIRSSLPLVIVSIALTACGVDGAATSVQEPLSGASLWVGFVSGGAALEVEQYEGVPEMATAADAVVVGTFGDIRLGRVVQEPEVEGGGVLYAVATVEVQDILRLADAGLPESFEVEFLLSVSDSSEAEASIRNVQNGSGPFLFFLRNKGAEAQRMGLAPAVVQAEWNYYRLVSSQGLVESRDGTAVVPLGEIGDPLVDGVNGKQFADIVDIAR